MGAMWGSLVLALIMGLAGRFTGTCRHIAGVTLLRFVADLLVIPIGHSGRGSSAGFGCRGQAKDSYAAMRVLANGRFQAT